LGKSSDVQRFLREDLRREIVRGLEQADAGEVAHMDISAVKREVQRRLAAKPIDAGSSPNQPGAP